eukprot:1075224-Rhodomonas_salina.2
MNDEEKEALQLAGYRMRVLNELKRKQLAMRKRRSALNVDEATPDVDINDDFTANDNNAFDVLKGAVGNRQMVTVDHEDQTIFRCLPPPTPNAMQPQASRNLRGWARDLYDNKWFENMILTCIIISTTCLAVDSPISDFSMLDPEFFWKADVALFCIFLIEFLLKLLDHGVYWEHPQAYFRQVGCAT